MAINPKAPEKIDDYIQKQKSDEYREILTELRDLIHSVDPKIQEDWKWRAPNYTREGLVCWTVAFKNHIGINFYKGSLINDKFDLFDQTGVDDKHNRIIKINSKSDLDKNAIRYYVSEGIRLNVENINPKPIRKKLIEPDFFKEAMSKNKAARTNYDKLSYSRKKDYIDWLGSAKREETQKKRLKDAMYYLENDIDRHAKYKKKQ